MTRQEPGPMAAKLAAGGPQEERPRLACWGPVAPASPAKGSSESRYEPGYEGDEMLEQRIGQLEDKLDDVLRNLG